MLLCTYSQALSCFHKTILGSSEVFALPLIPFVQKEQQLGTPVSNPITEGSWGSPRSQSMPPSPNPCLSSQTSASQQEQNICGNTCKQPPSQSPEGSWGNPRSQSMPPFQNLDSLLKALPPGFTTPLLSFSTHSSLSERLSVSAGTALVFSP